MNVIAPVRLDNPAARQAGNAIARRASLAGNAMNAPEAIMIIPTAVNVAAIAVAQLPMETVSLIVIMRVNAFARVLSTARNANPVERLHSVCPNQILMAAPDASVLAAHKSVIRVHCPGVKLNCPILEI